MEELPHGAHHHRSAPDDRGLFGDEETDRDELKTVFLDRVKALTAGRSRPLVHRVEHHRHGGAVDVGVEQAHAIAEPAQRDGEIRRDGRFAHPAFAAGDGDDPFRAGQPRASGLLAQLRRYRMNLQFQSVQTEVVGEGLMDPRGDLLERRLLAARMAHGYGETAGRGRRDLLDDAESNDIGGIAGIGHPPERGQNVLRRRSACHDVDYFRAQSEAVDPLQPTRPSTIPIIRPSNT